MVFAQQFANGRRGSSWKRIRISASMIGWWLFVLWWLMMATACSTFVASATNRLAVNLADAISDHDDAATVAAAGPAYLLMMDAMVRSNPDDVQLLIKAAGLYGVYTGAFVQDTARARKLTARAMEYALRAVCIKHPQDCSLRQSPFSQFEQRAALFSLGDVPVYYTLGASWAGWIQARKDDFDAVAELARVKILMHSVLELEEGHMHGGPHLYLGVLSILLPPALGGEPETARHHFERAIELSKGRNLTAKVMYARHYARMLFDRSLHDRLLNEVLAADPYRPGFVLANTMAQQQAKRLLESASDYF